MSNKSFCLSVLAVLASVSAYSEQERVIRIQNHLRVGYDSNVYLQPDAQESAEIMDILNISGKLNFSSRSDAVFSYQPEVRYRPDADPKTITFHDAYAKLNHALSQRVFVTVSDRFRYQMRDAQAGNVSQTDANYLENDLMGALDVSLNPEYNAKLGGGYEFRTWDDDNYGEVLGNNYDQYTADGSLFRSFNKDATKGMLGVNYWDTEYEGNRGSSEAVTLMGGADHVFNPNMNGFGRVGVSLVTTDTIFGSEDNTAPYLDTGLEYNPSDRTSINGNVGFSIYQAENSAYNAQDRMTFGVGARHDLTAKISLVGSLAYVMSSYDAAYAIGTLGDATDEYLQLNLRGSYQINRNNFLELGYEYTDRAVDKNYLSEFDRSRIDVGWRLRL